MAAVASPPAMASDTPVDASKNEATALQQASDSAHRVLTPPTSEDMDKHDGNSSELSDFDDDEEDDIGEVVPDHYWDQENGGKIPVFKPTMDQFRSFKKYVDKIDKYGMKSGIVKVVAPQEWRESLPTLEEAVKTIKVKNPITQEFAGTHGQYTQANIEKQRSYNLPQWKALTMESNHQPPAKRGERRREPAAPKPKPARPAASSPAVTPDGLKRRPGRPRKNPLPQDVPVDSSEVEIQVPPTPTSPDRADHDDEEEVTPAKRGAKAKAKPKGRQPTAKSVSSRRMNNQHEVNDIDEESFTGFDYHLENLDDFSKERCQELEEVYWKTLNYGTPMYGADMPGSLFDERTTSWNVAALENLLDVLGTKVPGVNTAYLYLGMWKATFAWHLEDVDLYSINYIHFGAPKQWYSISQEDARKFENAMRTMWPMDYKHCDQFLRHKTYLISPEKLKKEFGIKVNKLVHYEGEFVITYPYGYHSGHNLGYNCAESVNFATEAWLDYGRIAKKCECEADSVWVDVNEIERKLRGEPTPEYYEVTDDEGDEEIARPPTPPRGKPKKKPAASRKRKREPEPEPPKKKVKRVKVLVRTRGKEPCVLCPNDVKFDILLPTDNLKQAHRLCALYTPETYLVVENGQEKVCGVSRIDKARLELKCNYCHSKKGACFQCAAKKCTRAFHATCAAAAGVLVDVGPVPTWDTDGTEYYCEGYDFRCRFHRPRRPKNVDVAMLESNKLVRKHGKSVAVGDVVQALMLQGDVFAGVVVENRPTEGAVVIDVDPEGDRVEVEYKYLLVLDPSESQRPKPSPEAKLLPEHLSNNEDVNADNRKDGVPEMGDPFLDPNSGHKWQEWNAANTAEVRNPFQVKIDLSKAERLWYYLGKTSTEAKAQYTADPRKKVHNPKANFLDKVSPASRSVSGAVHRTSHPQYSNTLGNMYPTYPAPRTSYPGTFPNYALSGTGPAPNQHQQQQAAAKPYQYKPKIETQAHVYQPHYDYTQQGHTPIQSASSSSAPQYASAPAAYSHNRSAGLTSQAPYSPVYPPSAHGPNPSIRLDNSPPYRNFYAQAEQKYSQQPPASTRYQALTTPRQSGLLPTKAPMANMTIPAAPANFTPPSLRGPPSSTSSKPGEICDYLDHISKYPYLKNSFLRRPKQYTSPYAPTEKISDGVRIVAYGPPQFSPEYQDKLNKMRPMDSYQLPPAAPISKPAYSPPVQVLRPISQSRSPTHGTHDPILQQLSRSHMVQYQTADQFQQEVRKETEKVSPNQSRRGSQAGLTGDHKFDFMIQELNKIPNERPASALSHHQGNGSGHSTPTLQGYPQNTAPPYNASQSYAGQPMSFYASAPPVPSRSLPPLQPNWISSYATSAGMTRTSSGDRFIHYSQGSPMSHHPAPASYNQQSHTSQSHTPRATRSPERPDYSPLSDVATPMQRTSSTGMQRSLSNGMQVSDILCQPTGQQNMGFQARQYEEDKYRRQQQELHTQEQQQMHTQHQQQMQLNYQQQQHHQYGGDQNQRPPIGLGLEGYKMS